MSKLLSTEDIRRLEAKIAAVETMTSVEFKVIVCSHAWFGLKKKAHKLFLKYGLDKTRDRNAVLILMAEKDREFLIYGDKGIHEKVGELFWDSVKEDMLELFKQNNIVGGLSLGLSLLAEIFVAHFPKTDETNGLSNKIAFEK